VEENLLRTESSTGKAIDSQAGAVGDRLASALWPTERRAQAAALGVLGILGLVALAWDARVAGLGLLSAVGLVAGLVAPQLLGPLVVLLLPAGDAAHVLGAQVVPLEAVVGGGAIGYLVRVATKREVVRLGLADWTFVALVAFIAVSVLGPVDNSDRIREILFWGALGVVFHTVVAYFHDRLARTLLFFALVVATLVEAGWALFEYVDRWSERSSSLGGAIVFPLPEGTLGHANALGQFLVLAVLGVLALSLGERGTLRWLGFATAAAGSLALVVTFSRASWIAFAAGACVYLLERRTRGPVLFLGGVAALGAFALAIVGAGAIGARISSLFSGEGRDLYEFRLELVERAAAIVADHPLTGLGDFEEVGLYVGRPDVATHPHNLFLGLAVFFGIPAALAFGGLVLLALKGAWSAYRAAGPLRLTALGFVALLVAFLVDGLFEYPFWNPQLSVFVVLALAAAVSLDRQAASERSPPGTIPSGRARRL
jgi:O-antigen ligase